MSRIFGAGTMLAMALTATSAGFAAAAPATITIPGERLFPESVTSTRDGTLFVGSIVEGGIRRVAPGAAEAESWIAPAAHGMRSTFGVLADERSGTPWVCSNDVSGMGIPSPGVGRGSTVNGFDLATGTLKHSAALPGEHPFCNDIAVAPDGQVYVADTLASRVLQLTPDGKGLAVWATDPQLTPAPNSGGVDGLVFGKDGALYLTTFNKGELFRITVAPDGSAGEITKLAPSQPLTLPDTLRLLEDGRLLLVEGGGRLDRVTVEGDRAMIEVLADGLNGPASVAQVGDTAWVLEGQLGILFDPALKDQQPKLPFRIVAVPLAGR